MRFVCDLNSRCHFRYPHLPAHLRCLPCGDCRLYRGASSVLSGCIPAHAAYFSIYEMGKEALVNSPGGLPFLFVCSCSFASSVLSFIILNHRFVVAD